MKARAWLGGAVTKHKICLVAILQVLWTATSTAYYSAVPRIGRMKGKVNQHFYDCSWHSDPDKVSGYNINELEYCRKFWPGTKRVEPYKKETLCFCERDQDPNKCGGEKNPGSCQYLYTIETQKCVHTCSSGTYELCITVRKIKNEEARTRKGNKCEPLRPRCDTEVIKMDSCKIIPIIDLGVAPMALRIPNSLVRSRTT